MIDQFSQHVRISTQAKRITLQRYLLSKVVYFMEEFSLTDLTCLFENQLWLENKVQADANFCSTFGRDLESLSKILQQVNFRMEFTDRSVRRFSMRIKQELGDFILPKRNYPEVARRYKGLFHLEPNSPLGKLVKLIPPKARVGKGYSDKGTARNPAVDGSPSWQEVAMSRGPLYHKGVKKDVQVSKGDPGPESISERASDGEPRIPSRFARYLQEVAETTER